MVVLAIGWLLGFSIWFHHFTLPNNPQFNRPGLWQQLPWTLLELVNPREGPRNDRGWHTLPQRGDLALVAVMILAGAWGQGHALLAVMRLPLAETSLERTVFAFAAGLAGLSLITLGCGLAGWLARSVLGGAVAVSIAVGVLLRLRVWIGMARRAFPSVPRGSGSRSRRSHAVALLPLVCFLVAVPFVLAMLLGSMLPPTDFDTKAYHLVGPKEWFQNGRISFLPHNVYTSFPFLTEMFTLLGMVLRDDWYRGALAGKAVLACFAPLTALALYAAGRRWVSPAAGAIAALVWLTTPWTYRISIIAYAEGGLSFFLFTAMFAAGIGLEQMARGENCTRQVLLSGLLAGSAMACKYTGAVQVVAPLGLAAITAPWILRRRQQRTGTAESTTSSAPSTAYRQSLRVAAAFSAGILLAVGPWLLKNTFQTGNPVYPLQYSVFGGRDLDAELAARFHAGHSLPADRFTPPHLVGGLADVSARNDWHSSLLYALAPLAFFAALRRQFVSLLWLYVVWLFFAWWLLTHRIDRFWVPMIPVVALLAGIGAVSVRSRIWVVCCGIAIGANVLFNLAFVSTGLAGNNAWLAGLDLARRQAEYTAGDVAFLNSRIQRGQLPGKSRVLLVGQAQVFDARFPLVYHTVFDDSIFDTWFAASGQSGRRSQWKLADPAQIRRRLAAEGITHVAVNWQEVLRYRTSYGYTDFVSPRRFANLVRLGVLAPSTDDFWAPVDTLPATARRELDEWAPELKQSHNGQVGFISVQLFPVQPPAR